MEDIVRPAVTDDHARLMQIAAEGGFTECDSLYLSFIAGVGRMLYLTGQALGGGPPLQPASWMHGRDNLVGHFAAQGAVVTENAVVTVADGVVEVVRLDAADAIDECERLLHAFDAGTTMQLYVPEQHPLAEWLLAHDFVVFDHDVLCTSAGVELPATLAVLHPGLS